MYSICCIGHITSDKIVTPQAVNYLPGGTAYYFSCALSRLDVGYLLVTSLAPAEMHYVEALRAKGIGVRVQPGRHTVFFENIYGDNPDDRSQNVLQTSDPFTMDQLHDVDAQIFHLGPLLADDISPDLIQTLSTKGRISLDVQGYLRRVVNQKVYPADWPQKQQALQHFEILKADVAELQALTGCSTVAEGARLVAEWGVKEVVVTNASKGSVIYSGGVFYDIPAYPPPVIADATGCGDTYMAGYLYRRSKGDAIQQAGEFAAAMAGLKTAKNGAFEGTEADVLQFKAGF
ncbi:MAG TPA: PfkB family carbohydrate kinase [Mucilaginibacter sp.]|jgi:sugar/nucleoside kinase (ribokinase family)|nr:PfkB family carbohydrate kinase [Mucilaginibacter sp.]